MINKVMLLSNNQELINKMQLNCQDVLAFDNFMAVFEQLNFHNPDMIVFDFSLIKNEHKFMLQALPKKTEQNYIKLVSIGIDEDSNKNADFALMFDNIESIKATNIY